jgi:hypothetical protein
MAVFHTCPVFPTSYKFGEPPERLRDYEPLAKTCSSFVLRLFAHPSILEHGRSPYEALPYFIAVALSQSRLPDVNALAALTLLERLKTRHPDRFFKEETVPQCVEAESLFLSSYIAATKVLNDDRYGLQFWVRVGQNKFSLEELVQMEKKFLADLDWRTAIDDASLATYEMILERRKQTYGSKGWDSLKVWDALNANSDCSTSTSSTSQLRGTGTETSPASSYCSSTPSDPSISSPVVTAGLLRLQLMESKQNIETIDKRLDELQLKFKALTSKSPRSTPSISQKRDSKRHLIKDKLHHAFH